MTKRILRNSLAVAALIALGLGCSGCAAAIGTAMGSTIGGLAWATMKGGSLAYKGGRGAVKVTGAAAGDAYHVARGHHGDDYDDGGDEGVPVGAGAG